MVSLVSRRRRAVVPTYRRQRDPCWLSMLFGLAAIMSAGSSMAQTQPVAYGYLRAVRPGIPGGPVNDGLSLSARNQKLNLQREVFAPEYSIYLAVKPGSDVSASWAWVRGKTYQCALTKVSTPVVVDRDVGVKTEAKVTLVPKSSDDVYHVVLGTLKSNPYFTKLEQELEVNNEFFVALILDHKLSYATVRSMKVLPPAAAM